MAMYYWNKYNVNVTNSYSEPSWVSQGRAIHGWFNHWTSYTFNTSTGQYSTAGTSWDDKYIVSGNIGYMVNGSTLQRIVATKNGTVSESEADRSTKTGAILSQSYSRGSLVQSDIVAAENTYPVNDRHSDGYWYVRGAAVNTAPTTPGTFTQPTGTLEIGDSKVISWGASTDAQNNLSKYVLEASINNGAFAIIGQPTTPSFAYTVPTATSITFRVKAVDAGGLESGYRTSAAFTVTKPQYYWSKYNNALHSYYYEGSWYTEGERNGYYMDTAYRGYSFNTTNGTFTQTGGTWGTNNPPIGSVGYNADGRNLYRYVVTGDSRVTYASKTSGQTTDNVRGSLVQSDIIGEETTYPNNVRHSDGFWYVRGLRVNQSIIPPGAFTTPATNAILLPGQALNLLFGASSAPGVNAYEVQSRYNGGTWANVGAHISATTRAFTVTTDKALATVEFRVRAKNTSDVYSDYIYSEAFRIQHNAAPSLTLTSGNNQNITENGKLAITGSAIDTDNGNAVVVKYRINGGTIRNIISQVSDGATPISFSKELTMKNGRLYDGTTEITGDLSEGDGHVLSVWAEDDQGGVSTTQTRTFYVTLNRPVELTIDQFDSVSELINNDTVTISGSVADPDGNQITVFYSVNDAEYIEVYSGLDSAFSFDFPVGLLKVGQNAVKVRAVDTYNAETLKTVTMNKAENNVTLSRGENRYKVTPPNGQARGLALWIERDATLEVNAHISMVNDGENESFQPMEWKKTEQHGVGVLEDQYTFQADDLKSKITLAIEVTGGTGNIKLITGVMSE